MKTRFVKDITNAGANILPVVLIGIIILVLGIITAISSKKFFNNGYCPNCDIKYVAVARYRGSTYYECPNCRNGVWYKK